jgi:hypothetical protein
MFTPRTLGVLLTAVFTATFLPSVAATAAVPATAPPDAQVRINGQAFEAQRGMILASFRVQCAPGFEFSFLTYEFSQGDVVTPTQEGTSFPCDGTWHRKDVSSLEAFEPGPATLSVRLAVTDIETGDPGRQAFQTKQIFVRPAARIFLPRYADLKRSGAATMVIHARCDRPWTLAQFSWSATQGAAGDSGYLTLPNDECDGVVHAFPVRVESTTGPLKRGRMRVDATIDLLDEFGDPVTQATASRRVLVR